MCYRRSRYSSEKQKNKQKINNTKDVCNPNPDSVLPFNISKWFRVDNLSYRKKNVSFARPWTGPEVKLVFSFEKVTTRISFETRATREWPLEDSWRWFGCRTHAITPSFQTSLFTNVQVRSYCFNSVHAVDLNTRIDPLHNSVGWYKISHAGQLHCGPPN